MDNIENLEEWTKPEYFFSTVLSYIYSVHKEEFESLPETDTVHIPVVGGTYRITKKDLLEEARKEVESAS